MNRNQQWIILAAITLVFTAGCGGTKILKEPQPIITSQPLAAASDQRVIATLDWVIVRDGPGTWAKNADWDEYLLRISNLLSDQPIQVTSIAVVDSLNTRVEPQPGRKQLVKGSKQSARRYKRSGIKVKAGRGAGTMLVAGAAVTVVGYGAAAASVVGAGYGAAAGGAGAAAGGLLLLGPALAVGGIVRAARNSAVNNQIEQRQKILPLEVPASGEIALDIFFPLAPSPRAVELAYSDTSGEHIIVIDTSAALSGLHIDAQH